MLDHNETLQEDQEDVVSFDFDCYTPEDWGQPRYWLTQKVTWLQEGREVFGTIMGIAYDELEEEWEYEIALALQFRERTDYASRLDYSISIYESRVGQVQAQVRLNRLFNA